MSTNLASSPQTYRESAILTASPERLVVMLFDGACRFLGQAALAMRDGNVSLTHQKLRRAEAIICHLQNTLDLSHGEIPQNLLSIYLFCRRHLNAARVEHDPTKIDDVIRLFSTMRETWDQICTR